MDAKGKKKDASEINFVHNDTIHTENVLKERKYEGKNFKFDYTFNMNNCNTYIYININITNNSISIRRETSISSSMQTIYIE